MRATTITIEDVELGHLFPLLSEGELAHLKSVSKAQGGSVRKFEAFNLRKAKETLQLPEDANDLAVSARARNILVALLFRDIGKRVSTFFREKTAQQIDAYNIYERMVYNAQFLLAPEGHVFELDKLKIWLGGGPSPFWRYCVEVAQFLTHSEGSYDVKIEFLMARITEGTVSRHYNWVLLFLAAHWVNNTLGGDLDNFLSQAALVTNGSVTLTLEVKQQIQLLMGVVDQKMVFPYDPASSLYRNQGEAVTLWVREYLLKNRLYRLWDCKTRSDLDAEFFSAASTCDARSRNALMSLTLVCFYKEVLGRVNPVDVSDVFSGAMRLVKMGLANRLFETLSPLSADEQAGFTPHALSSDESISRLFTLMHDSVNSAIQKRKDCFALLSWLMGINNHPELKQALIRHASIRLASHFLCNVVSNQDRYVVLPFADEMKARLLTISVQERYSLILRAGRLKYVRYFVRLISNSPQLLAQFDVDTFIEYAYRQWFESRCQKAWVQNAISVMIEVFGRPASLSRLSAASVVPVKMRQQLKSEFEQVGRAHIRYREKEKTRLAGERAAKRPRVIASVQANVSVARPMPPSDSSTAAADSAIPATVIASGLFSRPLAFTYVSRGFNLS